MPIVLLLEDEEQRARRVEKHLRAALPFIQIRHVRTAIEFRYAFVTQCPRVAILGHCAGGVTNLACEATVLRPEAKLIVLAREASSRDTWGPLSDIIVDVVDEDGLVEALAVPSQPARIHENPGIAEDESLSVVLRSIDSHRMKNRLAGLLAGLHAMAAELRATAAHAEQVPQVADEYVDRLVDVVGDMCAMIAAAEARSYDEEHG